MTALPFVVPSFGFLAWFSLIPLFFVLLDEKVAAKTAFKYGYIFGFIFYVILCTWFYSLSSLKFIETHILISLLTLGLLLVSLIMALGYGVVCFLFKKIKTQKCIYPVIFATLWILNEFIHRFGSLGFTWGEIALTQYMYTPIIRSASLFGSLFISFLIALVNGFTALGISFVKHKKRSFLCFSLAVCIFTFNLLYGFFAPQMPRGNKITASAVWGNDNPFGVQDSSHNRLICDTLLRESEKCDSDIILWTETALALIVNRGDRYFNTFCEFSKRNECTLMVGCYREDDGKLYSSVQIFERGEYKGSIDKRHPVPFGEYIPMRGLLSKIMPQIDEISPKEEEVIPFEGNCIVKTQHGRAGGIICYDSTFAPLTRQSVRDGAEYLILSTNDSWFYGTHAIENHFSQSVFRTVECGRYLLRSANKGVSCIISPEGEIAARGDVYAFSMDGEMYTVSEVTFYTRVGDIIVYVALLLSLGLILFFKIAKNVCFSSKLIDKSLH